MFDISYHSQLDERPVWRDGGRGEIQTDVPPWRYKKPFQIVGYDNGTGLYTLTLVTARAILKWENITNSNRSKTNPKTTNIRIKTQAQRDTCRNIRVSMSPRAKGAKAQVVPTTPGKYVGTVAYQLLGSNLSRLCPSPSRLHMINVTHSAINSIWPLFHVRDKMSQRACHPDY